MKAQNLQILSYTCTISSNDSILIETYSDWAQNLYRVVIKVKHQVF